MYYVYKLIDPRCGTVFYVGKGKDKRINAHEKEALKGKNGAKCDKIRDIINSGNKVKKEIVKRFASENDAYQYEEKLISKIGLNNLTNVAKGGRNPYSYTPIEKQGKEFIVSLIAEAINKASGKQDLYFRFAGLKVYLGDRFKKIIHKIIFKTIDSYGEIWTIEEFKKHNITIKFIDEAAQNAPICA